MSVPSATRDTATLDFVLKCLFPSDPEKRFYSRILRLSLSVAR